MQIREAIMLATRAKKILFENFTNGTVPKAFVKKNPLILTFEVIVISHSPVHLELLYFSIFGTLYKVPIYI